MKSDQREGCSFTIKIVPGRSHLDSIYFGNLLIEALGQARDDGLGIVSFDVVRVEDFKFMAKLWAGPAEFAEMVLKGVLEAIRDSGYGLAEFEVKSDSAAIETKAEKVSHSEDARDLWTDLV